MASMYKNRIPLSNKVRRFAWMVVCTFLFKPTPAFALNGYRSTILRLFGAKVGVGCKIAPSVRFWAPWNVAMGDYVCLAAGVDCYCVDKVVIGSHSTVSQRSFICTASHDIQYLERPLTHQPIIIGDNCWICAEVLVSMGVEIGNGSVVAARSVVVNDVGSWLVVAGHPAKVIKKRTVK